MTRDQILPINRPPNEDRQLCKGVKWPEVREILSATNLKDTKMSVVRRVFDGLHLGKGIKYIGKTPRPTEPKLEFKVGEKIDMTADFHSMLTEVNKILFRSQSKQGMDFERYPNVTRDYQRGWTADDPLKRLAYAQTMIIAKRKQVEPNVEVVPEASDDDGSSTSQEEESYDPGTDEDNQPSSEMAEMPVLPAIESGNSTNGSTDSDAALGNAFNRMTCPNESPIPDDEAVDVVTEPVPRGTPTETSSVSHKRVRNDMATRAEAVGLDSAKRQRDDKIKAAEEAIETAEQELSEAVLAKEEELRLEEEELRLQQEAQEKQAREEQHNKVAVELEESRRRKRAPNRKNHWGTVKRRQTDADGHLRCAVCNFWDYRDAPGTQISDRELRLDHILALELDGRDNDPDNLQILCGMCDNRKTGYDNQEYFKKRATEARDLVRVRASQ
tara:strand:- start:4811 stop:6139 length:1329 start_codon:yes stop_codon:yes gene_type:complete